MRVRRVLKLAGLGWLAWRLFGEELHPRFSGTQERPIRLQGRTVFVGNRELFVRETGPVDGLPVVLVHGLAFDGEMTFHKIVPLLSSRFRVLVPDHRNHGKSDRIRGRFDVEDLADDLAGLLDALDVGPAIIFGYSLGGMVAQALAYRHPRHVAHLVLAATAAQPVARFRWASRLAFLGARTAGRLAPVEVSWVFHRELQRMGVLDKAHARWMWERLLARDTNLYYETISAVYRFDSRSWLGRLATPATIAITTNDQIIWPPLQYELASALRDADIHEIVGARHEAIFHRADEFAKLIAGAADRASAQWSAQ